MSSSTPLSAHYTEADDPLVLAPERAVELLRGAPWRRFAVLGDSIAAGTGDPSPGYATTGWADRVAATLRAVNPELAYRNTGRVGATSTQVRQHQLPEILEFGPDLVHVNCGGNDLFEAGGDPNRLRDNLSAMLTALAEAGAQLSMFTVADVWAVERMEPMRAMRARMAQMNELIRALATEYDAVLTEFWEHPVRLRPSVMSADLIHFTTSGHAVVATEVTRALAERLGRV
ncbi:SGNH/GDSL hydrolase family protein [Nocardia caishijiensis]|uniref:Lysophospholipase L1-like esterase n=1 Tax=Nocardia caishijiensis TaxID=184756 RepID=A0ABQ6YJ28_9NOCA|nr:SGNH/GDSL hydrolase family protein [Nocardia caishijiensis]KAF0845814.1 lysophospholipase L1-like esterase [Nocardia caishijiensis]